MKHGFLGLIFLFSLNVLYAQQDSAFIRRIYDEALLRGRSYATLDHLCNKIGHRLSGTPAAEQAVQYMAGQLRAFGFDTVYLQPVRVPVWQRGRTAIANVVLPKPAKTNYNILALGGSVAGDVTAEVIEVRSLDDLKLLGKDKVQGKIVFFNRPLDPRFINTGRAYGAGGDQRRRGPSEAARYGAVGCLVRSLTLAHDDHPHTGSTSYDTTLAKIPAAALSTLDADALSQALNQHPKLQMRLALDCKQLPDASSYNVIGELRGTELPNEVIVVGGHLDSWDVGQGAHDDGTGVVHSAEALRLLRTLGYRPKRTLRCVLFMNEENGLRGGTGYAAYAKASNEKHIAAIESDGGGFTPRGFGITANEAATQRFLAWRAHFTPYLTDHFVRGGGGADIGPLAPLGTAQIGFICDGQRYFDIHHTTADTFDKVNRRELELGCAAMASMLYLLSEYGL